MLITEKEFMERVKTLDPEDAVIYAEGNRNKDNIITSMFGMPLHIMALLLSLIDKFAVQSGATTREILDTLIEMDEFKADLDKAEKGGEEY